jgi:hypothetical protein
MLDPDISPISHEEATDKFMKMAYYGGVFTSREMSIRAMDYVQSILIR